MSFMAVSSSVRSSFVDALKNLLRRTRLIRCVVTNGRQLDGKGIGISDAESKVHCLVGDSVGCGNVYVIFVFASVRFLQSHCVSADPLHSYGYTWNNV